MFHSFPRDHHPQFAHFLGRVRSIIWLITNTTSFSIPGFVLNGHKEGSIQQQEPAFKTICYNNKLLKISSICKISTITETGPINMYLCQALRLWSLAFASRSNRSKEFSFWVLLLLMSGGAPRIYKFGVHRGSFLVAIPSEKKRCDEYLTQLILK
jgi:hypothetical protein